MKIIFLDINGVIEPLSDFFCFQARPIKNFQLILELERRKTCVRYLNLITQVTGAQIVVSSTMRYSGMDYLNKYFTISGITGKLIGMTPQHKEESQTKDNRLRYYNRDEEIKAYLLMNKVDRFLILDDSNYFITPELVRNFIKVDSFKGLTQEIADKAIAHLGVANELQDFQKEE